MSEKQGFRVRSAAISHFMLYCIYEFLTSFLTQTCHATTLAIITFVSLKVRWVQYHQLRIRVDGQYSPRQIPVLSLHCSLQTHQDLIMSPSLENAESEWLAQYAALRQTLAELRMGQLNGETKGYGHDIMLDDEDLVGGSGSDDLWNVFRDDEQDDEYSSDMLDGVTDFPNGEIKSPHPYGQEWLRSKCLAFASSKSGMDAEELRQQLSAMLASDMRGLHTTFLLFARD